MSSYIKLYFIFTNGTFTFSHPTHAFLFISRPVPETSILSNSRKPLNQRQWHPSPYPALPSSLPPSIPPSSYRPSLHHPSLPLRSVYGFDFILRFILSIPIRSTPSLFLFTQIHLITSAAVANQRIHVHEKKKRKKINTAHPGSGGAFEQRWCAYPRWEEWMRWNAKIHCNGLWDE